MRSLLGDFIAELRAAGLPVSMTEHVDAARALTAALTFARRRRVGPFGPEVADRALRDRQLAAMLRAGHPLDLSRRILAARDLSDLGLESDDEAAVQAFFLP